MSANDNTSANHTDKATTSTSLAFSSLIPDVILDAVESTGLWSDSRIYPLNSYENRVYQVGIEDSAPVIAKFYRPERWTEAQILEEHATLLKLKADDVPVVAPLEFEGKSLFNHKGLFSACRQDWLGNTLKPII
ncbi:phosphotransferase [Marinomonas sp. GJ51-6]|uniref:phosphotransferase n=1 Tax=Marinomonas sp. GJ51-6 TaxID=2992802 RepID=UPI00293459C9|nr:phosphotransferase [Marinomonas sp. GJ51-6]WOD07883.1 phosphotransferase [Marinomonas sp. GJ51-6]